MTIARTLQHQVIEAAKKTYREETCVSTFEECLNFHAGELVQAPFAFHVVELNRVWTIDVWDAREKQVGQL